MRGTCDACGRKNVELSRSTQFGIETFTCWGEGCDCICCEPGERCRGFCRVTYASEAEARADWSTIAPKHRTKERLEQMLRQVTSSDRGQGR